MGPSVKLGLRGQTFQSGPLTDCHFGSSIICAWIDNGPIMTLTHHNAFRKAYPLPYCSVCLCLGVACYPRVSICVHSFMWPGLVITFVRACMQYPVITVYAVGRLSDFVCS